MNYTERQAAQFLDFFEKNGISSFNLAILEPRKSGDGDCMKGDSRARNRAEVEKSLAWATARNMAGNNIYFRPARYSLDGSNADHPCVLLDDLTPETARKVVKKYRSIIAETSTNNFQAWIITNRPLAEDERHQAQAALAGLVSADPGSTSGEHFGRIPGYKNQKPGRAGFWIKVQGMNVDGPALDVSKWLTPKGRGVEPSPQGGRVPSTACTGSGTSDESAAEYRFALARLAAGGAVEAITENIAARALERGKRRTKGGAYMYALKTVTAAAKALR